MWPTCRLAPPTSTWHWAVLLLFLIFWLFCIFLLHFWLFCACFPPFWLFFGVFGMFLFFCRIKFLCVILCLFVFLVSLSVSCWSFPALISVSLSSSCSVCVSLWQFKLWVSCLLVFVVSACFSFGSIWSLVAILSSLESESFLRSLFFCLKLSHWGLQLMTDLITGPP